MIYLLWVVKVVSDIVKVVLDVVKRGSSVVYEGRGRRAARPRRRRARAAQESTRAGRDAQGDGEGKRKKVSTRPSSGCEGVTKLSKQNNHNFFLVPIPYSSVIFDHLPSTKVIGTGKASPPNSMSMAVYKCDSR